MCNRCNCGCRNRFDREERFEERCGCEEPLREVERMVRRDCRRRNCENRCACEFIRCSHRCHNCDWD